MKKLKIGFIVAIVVMMNVVVAFSQGEIPELQKKNFRVNSFGWQVKPMEFDGKSILVKVNPTGDIIEFFNGVDTVSGEKEQLYKYEAIVRVLLLHPEDSLMLPTWKDITQILYLKYHGDYSAFLKGEKIPYAGWIRKGRIEYLGFGAQLCCLDGDLVYFVDKNLSDEWNTEKSQSNSFSSVRLMKKKK